MNHCDHGHETAEEIRLLPLGKGSFLHVCQRHWREEINYRQNNHKSERAEDLPAWSSLQVIAQKIQKDESMTKFPKGATPARLDADGTAVPLSRIVHHPPAGACQGPGSALFQPELETETKERIPLRPKPEPSLHHRLGSLLKDVPAHSFHPGERVCVGHRLNPDATRGTVVSLTSGGLLKEELVVVALNLKDCGWLFKEDGSRRNDFVTFLVVHPSNLTRLS